MNEELKFVGVDDGHYAIKVCAGQDNCYYMPSRVVYGNRHIAGLTGEYVEDNCYEVDGTVLTIAETMILARLKIKVQPLSTG